MSHSQSRFERGKRRRLTAGELRWAVEDYVAATPRGGFQDCVAALEADGYEMPPADGEERLRVVFGEARASVLDEYPY